MTFTWEQNPKELTKAISIINNYSTMRAKSQARKKQTTLGAQLPRLPKPTSLDDIWTNTTGFQDWVDTSPSTEHDAAKNSCDHMDTDSNDYDSEPSFYTAEYPQDAGYATNSDASSAPANDVSKMPRNQLVRVGSGYALMKTRKTRSGREF